MKSKLMMSAVITGVLLAALTAITSAQEERRRARDHSGLARLDNGVTVSFSTQLLVNDKPGESRNQTTALYSQSNSISRILIDEETGVWFGYDLEAEPIPGTKQIRYTVKPLNPAAEQRLRESKWFRGFPPGVQDISARLHLPKTDVVEDGWSIEMILAVNRATKTEIGDRIRFSLSASVTAAPESPGPPRDFTVNQVELKVSNYRLYLNGQLLTADVPKGGASGALIWFYLPGHGRFICSLVPREGYDFQKIGVIEGNRMRFTVGSDQYEWTSASPIVGGSGSWNLWVRHDPDYQPDELWRGAIDNNCCLIGAADEAGPWVTNSPSPAAERKAVRAAAAAGRQRPRNYRMSEPGVSAPELFADTLQLKTVLVDLPGAQLPGSRWEASWQVWFIPEAEEQRAISERLLPGAGAVAWNPRPEDFRDKILLAEGSFSKAGLFTLADRTSLSDPIQFRSRIPESARTKFATLMTSYQVTIFDAKLNRTVTREGVWLTKPFDNGPANSDRAAPRTTLWSNFYVTPDGNCYTSQWPRPTDSTKWERQD
ncbi:MAG TPA: hypothetical protein VFD58_32440 [Blastocatellia bacterium]|nr:hypothetical protein [Blastocatellia bacterium]